MTKPRPGRAGFMACGQSLMRIVRSPEGEQMFEPAVGKIITVTGITAPIEVGAVVSN